ncbi:MAG: protein TolQ [Gammaproteobacteria bacterium]
MVTNQSLWVYFADAGTVVKCVMLILLIASVISWTLILERGLLIKRTRQLFNHFEDEFWSGADLTKLYSDVRERYAEDQGLSSVFSNGFKEFVRLYKQARLQPVVVMEGIHRAMRIAIAREQDRLENHLAILASIGSTSPYIGLFGTVWGIMTSFHALGNVQQATISMVAPGISEALIATAMGLFAAIPAVIAYNRYTNLIERLINQYDVFQEEFANILYRQVHGSVQS